MWNGCTCQTKLVGQPPQQVHRSLHTKREIKFGRSTVNLSLKIAVVATNGDLVSYCRMWQDRDSSNALVEPVAIDLAYRNMGLGRASVLEGIRRCGELGAKRAYVGSSRQFYRFHAASSAAMKSPHHVQRPDRHL